MVYSQFCYNTITWCMCSQIAALCNKNFKAYGNNVARRKSFFFFFFWPHPWHVEVPRPGIKPSPQQ